MQFFRGSGLYGSWRKLDSSRRAVNGVSEGWRESADSTARQHIIERECSAYTASQYPRKSQLWASNGGYFHIRRKFNHSEPRNGPEDICWRPAFHTLCGESSSSYWLWLGLLVYGLGDLDDANKFELDLFDFLALSTWSLTFISKITTHSTIYPGLWKHGWMKFKNYQ